MTSQGDGLVWGVFHIVRFFGRAKMKFSHVMILLHAVLFYVPFLLVPNALFIEPVAMIFWCILMFTGAYGWVIVASGETLRGNPCDRIPAKHGQPRLEQE